MGRERKLWSGNTTQKHRHPPVSRKCVSQKVHWLLFQIVLGFFFNKDFYNCGRPYLKKSPEDGQSMQPKVYKVGKTTYIMYREGRRSEKVLLANSLFYKH